MTSQPLYDLSPVLHLMLMGVVVALGPLSWLWLRSPRAVPERRLQALTVLVLFLTFDLVLFGAFTRLTDSGLGCPDWPGCYGNASPSGAHVQIEQAQTAMPTGPVTHGKAWIEMIHRYVAMGVGVLILTLAAGTWVLRRRGAAVSPWWPTVTLAWVCLQGAFGAWTVTMKLFPAMVTMHLLAGLVLLALLCRQAVAYEHAQQGRAPAEIGQGAWSLLIAGIALVWLQVALGGWVSTNYAVLACSDFPVCQGSWWPAMDFRHGFELWRHLGFTANGENIGFEALTAIHYVHRLVAYVVVVVLGCLAWQLGQLASLRRQARWIAVLMGWQLVTGISNVVLGWPLLIAVAHTGGAAALLLVLTWAASESRRAAPSPTTAAHSAEVAG
jgi:cytochrome c oxidase assembly protein subunit 15